MGGELTREQRDVLECAVRWIWHGAQPVGHGGPGRDPFRYWEKRLTSAAVRMLNAARDSPRERVTADTLRRMLAALPSPRSSRTGGGGSTKGVT